MNREDIQYLFRVFHNAPPIRTSVNELFDNWKGRELLMKVPMENIKTSYYIPIQKTPLRQFIKALGSEVKIEVKYFLSDNYVCICSLIITNA